MNNKIINVPPKSSMRFAFMVSLGALLISSILFLLEIDKILPPSMFAFFGILLATLIFLTIPIYNWAPLYILRLLLVSLPGLSTACVIILAKMPVLFTISAMRYQTYEIASKIMLLTLIAMSSCSLGWWLANNTKAVSIPLNRVSHVYVRYFIYIVLAILAGSLAAHGYGAFVWDPSFSYHGIQPLLNIGVFPVFATFSLIATYVLLLSDRNIGTGYRIAWGMVCGYVLLFCLILRGGRIDAVGAIIAIYFVGLAIKNQSVKPLRLVFWGVVIFIFVQAFGYYRGVAFTGVSFHQALIKSFANYCINIDGINYVHLPTIADVSATLYQVVGLVHEGFLDFQYGQTYLNYIPRTLPYFIYPNRPLDFTVTGLGGQVMTGSLFELAEAYANLGLLGCVIIPGILTFIFGKISQYALMQRSELAFLAYGIALALQIKGTWYQTFTFYKAPLTWFIIEILIGATIAIICRSQKLTLSQMRR